MAGTLTRRKLIWFGAPALVVAVALMVVAALSSTTNTGGDTAGNAAVADAEPERLSPYAESDAGGEAAAPTSAAAAAEAAPQADAAAGSGQAYSGQRGACAETKAVVAECEKRLGIAD